MSDERPVKTSVPLVLLTPLTPNWIRKQGGGSVNIADLDEATLRAVAKSWTAVLLERSRAKRTASR